jgi:dsRNA-specific ribonuclease
LDIAKHLLLGEGDAKLGIDKEPSVMEDLFESIIGAIYIDTEYSIEGVVSVVKKLLDVQEYLKSGTPPMQSFKNALQEWCADKKHKRETPLYKTVSETGPDHKKIYERACYIGDKIYGIGIGKNQKLADTAAAEEALAALIAEENAKLAALTTAASQTSLKKLRELTAKAKKPSPEFRDLGESARSARTAAEYEVECRCMGFSAIGKGPDKAGAKADAAAAMLKLIEKANAKKDAEKNKKSEAKSPKSTASVSKKTRKPSSDNHKKSTSKKSESKGKTKNTK